MSGKLETTAETAGRMAERWGLAAPIVRSNFHGTCCASIFDAQPGEVWAAPSEAHILSLALSGERRHRMWHDDRPIFDAPLPLRTNIVSAGKRPRAVISEPLRAMHVYIPAQHFVDAAEKAGAPSPSSLEIIDPLYSPDPVLEAMCRELSEVLRGDHWADRLMLDTIGAAITARILQRWSSLAGTRVVSRGLTKGGLAPWQVKRATEFMEDRLADDVSLDDLSQLLDLSMFHLCRAFKQSVGEPPHRWRQQRRMERAREMLAGTDLPVIEVAAAVGYDDPSRFATAFRKAFGVNPSQYRRGRRL